MTTVSKRRLNRALRPRGRQARSVENRVHQAWKSDPVKEIIDGEEKITALVHRQCHKCQADERIIRFDERGWAACENCGIIYNDYFAEPVPVRSDPYRSADRKFARSMKAIS